MINSFNTSNNNQQVFIKPVTNKMSVNLRMPAGYQGKVVSRSIVMMELLWQQYGLDLIHPEVSQWLERNAPDVKNLVAKSNGNNGRQFKVEANGTIELQFPLSIDDRLREVSSEYIWSQVQNSIDPQTEFPLAA
jgi:hypothetical protein